MSKVSPSSMTLATPLDQARCSCGRLLARRTPEGYELKCPRCKSVWRLPLDATKDIQWVSGAVGAPGESHEA